MKPTKIILEKTATHLHTSITYMDGKVLYLGFRLIPSRCVWIVPGTIQE